LSLRKKKRRKKESRKKEEQCVKGGGGERGVGEANSEKRATKKPFSLSPSTEK